VLVPGSAVLVSSVLIFLSWLGFGIVDRRLIRNQADAHATVVWVHHGLLPHWRAVRVSYQTTDGHTVLATVHTGSADAQNWIPGMAIPISYNQRHPSAAVYYAENGDFDDTREDFWNGVGIVGLLLGVVALTDLAVRLWGGRRYKRCFADSDDGMSATFLGVTRKRGVTTMDLETPHDPRRLSVRLLRGQNAQAFATGEKLAVHGRADGTGKVVVSSRGWERALLGRRRRDPNIALAQLFGHLASRSDDGRAPGSGVADKQDPLPNRDDPIWSASREADDKVALEADAGLVAVVDRSKDVPQAASRNGAPEERWPSLHVARVQQSQGASATAIGDGHDEWTHIGMDAVPAAVGSTPGSDPVVHSSTDQDNGQDPVSAGPQPDRASRSRHHHRWVMLAAGLVVIGIAAGVTAVTRHSPAGPSGVAISQQSPRPSGGDPSRYDVTYEVTGSSRSANVRYTLWGTLTKEEDNLDLAELARFDPYPFPYLVETMFPRGSHVFVEVRNNLPSGNVACTIDYGLSSGSTLEKRSAHGASAAICDVYLP
jgi:hypothetical protein